MTDFLDDKRREINARLAELKPVIAEYSQLQAASDALAGVRAPTTTAATATAVPARRRPGRPAGSKNRKRTGTARRARPAAPKAKIKAKAATATAVTAKPGRPKGSGERAAQALSLVTKQPGITIPEMAAKLNIKQNYLYRVLPNLVEEGKISKNGRGWHPAK